VRKLRRFPARFSKLQPQMHARAPKLGEHTREIARELGLSADALNTAAPV
jgi:crotonobetainyl-CoA:carnitine CoA-transferase CaiB-like acyl-CoA transferase